MRVTSADVLIAGGVGGAIALIVGAVVRRRSASAGIASRRSHVLSAVWMLLIAVMAVINAAMSHGARVTFLYVLAAICAATATYVLVDVRRRAHVQE